MAGLDIPTLVVWFWGDHDHVLPFSHLKLAAAALPNAEAYAFSKTGHMPQIERPDGFAAVVEDFLSRVVVPRQAAGSEGTKLYVSSPEVPGH